jgi:uncharacterized protein YjaZ
MQPREQISRQEYDDTTLGDDLCRIKVGIIPMPVALTEEFGYRLPLPIARECECADRTFLRTVLERDRHDQLSLTKSLIAHEWHHVALRAARSVAFPFRFLL